MLTVSYTSATTLTVDGFQASALFQEIYNGITHLSDDERKGVVAKAKSIFAISLKNKEGKEQTWTVDLKNGTGSVALGIPAGVKPDIVMSLSDQDFLDLSSGKANGQKLFMSGKLKVKGNVMLATKLEGVLKTAQKAKL